MEASDTDSAMQLYGLTLSTACAKVEIVLQIKQIAYDFTPPPGGTYRSASYQALIPAGTIPALRHEDFYLHDSDAICEYLEDIQPDPVMRPVDLRERARHRAISRFHDSRLDPAVRLLFPLIGDSGESNEQRLDDCIEGLNLRLSQLERLIAPHPFLAGDQISLADCGFLSTIRMAQRLIDVLGGQISLPERVDRWCDALSQHPIVGPVQQRNRQALDEWIASKRIVHSSSL